VTPGLLLGPHPCNAFALTPGLPSSWPVTLQPLCLGREPKARVATLMGWEALMPNVMLEFLNTFLSKGAISTLGIRIRCM